MRGRDGRSLPAIDIQLTVESDGWPVEKRLEHLVTDAVDAACSLLISERQQPFPAAGCELSLLFTDDAAIAEINHRWRDVDGPTNVLSFPAAPLRPGDPPGPMLGDIILARETISREAMALDIAFDHHLSHLLVHGFLHLFGYDHDDEREARLMEGLETRILAVLDLSDPYENSDPV